MIGIYKITNLINGKVYIGQSKNIEQRWQAHRNRPFNTNSVDYEKPLYRAIRKYGLDVFSFEVIEECEIDYLDEREVYWIDKFNATNPEFGYNLTAGGTTSTPIKLNQKQVDEIIDLLLSTTLSQEEIANQFNVTQRTISGINIGELWIKSNLSYPLRKRHQASLCKRCGIPIMKGSSYCVACNGYLHRKAERPEREELKSLIRHYPFTQIGKQFNVSDNTIRKWCKSVNLPDKSSVIKQYSDDEWENI